MAVTRPISVFVFAHLSPLFMLPLFPSTPSLFFLPFLSPLLFSLTSPLLGHLYFSLLWHLSFYSLSSSSFPLFSPAFSFLPPLPYHFHLCLTPWAHLCVCLSVFHSVPVSCAPLTPMCPFLSLTTSLSSVLFLSLLPPLLSFPSLASSFSLPTPYPAPFFVSLCLSVPPFTASPLCVSCYLSL